MGGFTRAGGVTAITSWLVLAAVVVGLLCLPRRKGWLLTGRLYRAGRFLPSPAPCPSRTASIIEAVVLGCTAAIIIAISATNRSTGGLLGSLDELSAQYAQANVIMFVCAVMGALLSVLIMLFGRTVIGTAVMAFVLIGYGLLLNGSVHPGGWLVSRGMAEPVVEYTINASGTNVEGAELWVNGVCLGKTPYTGTLDEFAARVPYWTQPPADYDTDKVDVPWYGSRGTSTSNRRRWIKFDLPARPSRRGRGPRMSATTGPSQSKAYYARVRYAGQWGLAGGGSSFGGGGSHLTYRGYSHFDVIFPQRRKRLDSLLDKARLADYRVGAEWFKAIETYDEDGWIALRTAADGEPRMMEVLDAWATWRYELDEVTDAESAWRTFTRIREEAETRRQYLSPSVAGRAVELLAGKLPRGRLVDEATGMIRNAGSYGYFNWTMNGRRHFGYSRRPGGVHLGRMGSSLSRYSGGRAGGPKLPMSRSTVAHAVWVLYDIQPEIVQQRIVPAIVCWQYRAGYGDRLLAAAYFGGPAIDKFLLRSEWHLEGREVGRKNRMSTSGGGDVNKWLYLLANLNDEAGRAFRRKRSDAVMDLADKCCGGSFGGWPSQLDFVFADPWLARKYWPRFARLAREKTRNHLKMQWRYLLKMGEEAGVSMFVDAWKETSIGSDDFDDTLDLLDELDPNTQAEVVEQLVQQVRDHPENLAKAMKDLGSAERVISSLKAHSHGDKLNRVATMTLRTLQQGSPSERGRMRKHIPLWLAHTQPDSPLVKVLAASDEPALRLMVMGALREYPTPENRQLLERLLKDADPQVRAAANDVAEQLEALAADSPSRYASDSQCATTEPSTTPTKGQTK